MAKRRRRPVYRKIRQFSWLCWWTISGHNCAFCGKCLFDGYNEEFDPSTLTLHHVKGSKHEDGNWEERAPVKHMVIAHSSCHKSYHRREFNLKEGKNIDRKALNTTRRFLAKAVKEMSRREKLLGGSP